MTSRKPNDRLSSLLASGRLEALLGVPYGADPATIHRCHLVAVHAHRGDDEALMALNQAKTALVRETRAERAARLIGVAVGLLRTEDVTGAVAALEASVGGEPSAAALDLLGRALLRIGQTERALDALVRAHQLDPRLHEDGTLSLARRRYWLERWEAMKSRLSLRLGRWIGAGNR